MNVLLPFTRLSNAPSENTFEAAAGIALAIQQLNTGDGSIRRYAIVLGFTRRWSPEWGGQTMFFDSPNSEVAESWNPAFNSLTIFRVPVLHCVNFVAPFAPEGRYSITGWLRDDPNISRPDLGD